MHDHEEIILEPGAARRIAMWQAVLVVPLALATLIGLIVLWPGDSPAGTVPVTTQSASIETGTVVKIGETDEMGATEVRMELASTREGTEVPVHVPAEIVSNGLDVGDSIEVMFTPAAVGTGTPYIFWDFERDVPLWLLIAAYVLIVAVVARGKGLAAVAGLAMSLAVVVLFMLPALLAGQDALQVVLVGAGAMMFASIYLAHGVSIRTTTAILGTAGGLIVTAGLAIYVTDRANLTGTLSNESLSLTGYGIQLDQILVCGMILAGLGALNDVTITQVSTVWELRSANPSTSAAKLYQQGMVVGRDHIASTIYTLAFAYVGTALPLLMAAAVLDRTFLDTLTTGEIAEEIVRTLVASIGLVLAIPLTTAIAARLARA